MYASIRQYKTKSPTEVADRVKDFLPIIKKEPGFIAYYAIDTGKNTVASVSVFETETGAEESNEVAAKWVRKNLSSLLDEPRIAVGNVLAHKVLTTETAR